MTTSEPDISELKRLAAHIAQGGPHEWGYRDLTGAGFIEDRWPFEVAAALPSLLAQLEATQAQLEEVKEALQSIARNTCCEACQEAALVARKALNWTARNDTDSLVQPTDPEALGEQDG